ncbi:uncharacterized protein LOC143469333 isoform X1 [Clavelina lepadiformis]|uniref:uncharacterized protein LOC143469333 isoform X1 n=1 Tax=Clavelina lepadiformis TaxID=159417 RepID=UPI0040420B0D
MWQKGTSQFDTKIWNFKTKRRNSLAQSILNEGRNEGNAGNTHYPSWWQGIRVRAMVWPEFTQVFLAFATLLFIGSMEGFIFTAMTVIPAMEGSYFTEANCTVVNTVLNSKTSCRVGAVSNHGVTHQFPCLQIYVIPRATSQTDDSGIVQQNLTTVSVHSMTLASSNRFLPTQSQIFSPDQVAIMPDTDSNNRETESNPLLLYQSELNFITRDSLYRRCSYLPSVCPNNVSTITADICFHAYRWGSANSNYKCYYDNRDGGRVILNKSVSTLHMLLSILFPTLGLLISIVCCSVFWKRNAKRVNRLFIYNSWTSS